MTGRIPGHVRDSLEWDLAHGAVLNGAGHPVPVFDFVCVAPDVAGYDGEQTLSILLHGKRIGRVYCEPDGVRTEMLPSPEDVADGSVVLWPHQIETT